MSMLTDIQYMESILREGVEKEIQSAFAIAGVGEYTKMAFDEANDANELATALGGMANELVQSRKSGSMDVAKDYGFRNLPDIQTFIQFASQVIRNPQTYYKEYDHLNESVSNIEMDLQKKLTAQEQIAAHTSGTAKDRAEAEIVKLVNQMNMLKK